MGKPYKDLLPPLSSAEYAALRADIKVNGVREPVLLDEDGNILDGHHRKRIDPNAPTRVIKGLSPEEKRAFVFRSNFCRRNLSPEQRDEVKGRMKETAVGLREEGRTQQEIADLLGVARPTVAAWLASDIPNVSADKGNMFDARLSLPVATRDEIVALVESGEKQDKVAAEFKISQGRVSKLVTQARKKRENKAKAEQIAKQAVEGKFEKLYDVIVLDPPWPMAKIEREVRPNQSEFDYPTMSEDELENLTVPCSGDCHVWVWTTHRFLPMAFRLLDAWGLKYVCTFTWHKPGGFQPVGLPQYNCEFALYARAGSPKFNTTKTFPVCFDAPRGKHSEKPDVFYETVRRVTGGRKGDGSRLDLMRRLASGCGMPGVQRNNTDARASWFRAFNVNDFSPSLVVADSWRNW